MTIVLLLGEVVFFAGGLPAQQNKPDEEDAFDIPEGFDVDEIPQFETTVADSAVAPSAASNVITQEQVATAHAASADKLLQLIPGVEIVQHGSEGKGHQIMLRGFDAAHGSDVEVTLEGVPLNEPSHVHGTGYVDLYGIIPEVVTTMSVHMGPFVPSQGNFATGGTLNFKLGAPKDLQHLMLGTGVDNYGKLRSFSVFSPNDTDSFVAMDAVHDPGFAKGREAKRGTMVAKWIHQGKRGELLSAMVSAQSARFETPGTMRLSDVTNGTYRFYDVHKPFGSGLSDRILARAGLEIHKSGIDADVFIYGMLRDFSLEENFTGNLYYADTGDRKKQEQRGEVGGAGFSLRRKLSGPFQIALETGATYRIDAFHQRETQVLSDGTEWRINRSNKIRINQLGTYAGVRLSPWDWVVLFPSVRFDVGLYQVLDHQSSTQAEQNFPVFSPRLAISFPLSEKLTFFSDYGKGFRFPEARSILYTGDTSDEDLKMYKGGTPDVSSCHTVEGGVESLPLSWLGLKLVGFGVFMERELIFDHVSNLTVEMDGTKRFGGEFDVSVSPTRWLRADSSITYANAQFNRSGNPVPNVPTWMGTVSIKAGEQRGPHGGVDLFWMGPHHLAHGAVVKGYTRFGLDGGYRFDNWDLTTVVENVFNTRIMEGTYHFSSWFDANTPRSMIPEIQYIAGNPFTLRLLLTVYL